MHEDLINVFVQIPNYIFLKDLNSMYLGCNKPLAEAAGFCSPDDLKGKTDFDFVWKEFANLYHQGDRDVLDGKVQIGVIEPLLLTDGRRINIIVNKKPFYNEKGQKIGVIGSYMEMKTAETHGTIDINKKNIPLTNRQLECLVYLAKGMTAKQIALQLNLSSRTIEAHIEALKSKFNCYNKSDLIKKAWSIEFVRQRLLNIY